VADSEYQAHEINDFQDVVCIPDVAGKRLGLRHGAKGPILWYRGVENSAEHRLLPSLYRSVDHRAEIHLCQSFQLHAEMRHERCPARDDLGGWLCLMQHYGLATRLLDWSGALLTATYFAVAHNRHSGDGRDEEDSAVWVLDPAALNFRFCSRSGLYSLSHPAMQPMLKRAFGIEQGEDEDRAVAIVPAQFDIRLMVQQSFFTLHGEVISKGV
jgi:hypothetical protein